MHWVQSKFNATCTDHATFYQRCVLYAWMIFTTEHRHMWCVDAKLLLDSTVCRAGEDVTNLTRIDLTCN